MCADDIGFLITPLMIVGCQIHVRIFLVPLFGHNRFLNQ